MLYIVIMPVEDDKIRRVIFIKANSYREVTAMLRLPADYTQWVCVTDLQLAAIMQSPEHYHTERTGAH